MNWTGYALQAASNLRVTRKFKLRIEKLQHVDGNGKVDWTVEGIEATPMELGQLMKEGLAVVYGPKPVQQHG